MKLDIYRIFFNVPLLAAVIAQVSAQVFKVFLPLFRGKKPNFKKFFYYGGIPSAHTAFISAVSMSLALKEGWDSSIFGLSFVVAGILIYDILKLRKTVELNQRSILELVDKKQISAQNERPQFKGHSFLEVFLGIFWGILWAVIVNFLFLGD